LSYRELRNFCEIMRSLGYHSNVSMENFREPNFELVADILYWFALRYDPKDDISDNIEGEKKAGSDGKGEGLDVMKHGNARIG
jgi:clusterin-associated protein 1